MSNMRFYDIESLDNIFTCAIYAPDLNRVIIYVLDDDHLVFDEEGFFTREFVRTFRNGQAVHDANPVAFPTGEVLVVNLKTEEGARCMARDMLMPEYLSNMPKVSPDEPVPTFLSNNLVIADTDEFYNPDVHHYMAGYNSFNYDTTMLAMWAFESFKLPPKSIDGQEVRDPVEFVPTVNAHRLREHNDNLFTPLFSRQMTRYLTRKETNTGSFLANPDGTPQTDWERDEQRVRAEMMRSGRHIDIARINEKLVHVALKRLCGMIGAQILESDKLDSHTSHLNSTEEAVELIAYNVSDVVNLAKLADNGYYQSQFATKLGMLEQYPELRFEYLTESNGKAGMANEQIRKKDDDGKLVIDKSNVRRNRLYADSSSQQLASRTLCPEGNLVDNEHVSFVYPDKTQAKEIGIEPFDVLEMIHDFYYDEIVPLAKTDEDRDFAIEQFDRFYDAYSTVRGKNYNDGSAYKKTFGEGGDVAETKDIPRTCLAYIGPDGKPTSCYVIFSIGGIHGAEYDKELYDADMQEYRVLRTALDEAQAVFGEDAEGAVKARNSVARAADPLPVEFSDGIERTCSDLLRSGFTKTRASWKDCKKPELFVTTSKGNMSLSKRYPFTSAAPSNHEDFTSYYPGLLRRMNVFANGDLGYDRYGEVFEGKQRYGKIMKDKSLPQEKRDEAARLRENVKLILNSASGGADASRFDTPIRMNNNILAMRMIGQMFTWMIGQAQAAIGARVISTNTDGLYTVLRQDINDAELERRSKAIGVPIEPEPLQLVSKDSNNRVEYLVDDSGEIEILSASGDLACWRGPNVTKSLDHPAIVDAVLTYYLANIAEHGGQAAFREPFDYALGKNILDAQIAYDADAPESCAHLLSMFQTIIAASPRAYSYPAKLVNGKLERIQHYNRVFFVKDELPALDANASDKNKQRYTSGVSLLEDASPLRLASGAIVTDAVKRKRAANGDKDYINDPVSLKVLQGEGITKHDLRANNREATVRKISGIATDQNCLIVNSDISAPSHETTETLMSIIDIDAYLELVAQAYESNWRNKPLKPPVKAGA